MTRKRLIKSFTLSPVTIRFLSDVAAEMKVSESALIDSILQKSSEFLYWDQEQINDQCMREMQVFMFEVVPESAELDKADEIDIEAEIWGFGNGRSNDI